jgi:hypothetical protein
LKESAEIKERETSKSKRQIFAKLYYKAKKEMGKIKPGIYKIEIANVLGVGIFHYPQPDVAIVKDSKNRYWIIPETEKLMSRWDIKIGNKIKVELKQTTNNFISSATILN